MSFQNMSRRDRLARLIVGLSMLWVSWAWEAPEEAIWPVVLRVFSLFPLVTGLLGWCPVYTILGLSTNKPKTPPRDH